MRRSLILVTAGVTSMVVIAFLVPLAILVGALAFDRAVTGAEREAESIARLVAVLSPSAGTTGAALTIGEERLKELGASMILPDGSVYGVEVPDGEDLSVALGGTAHRASVESGEAIYLPVAQSDGDVTVVRVVAPHDELTSGVRRSWLILAGLGVVLVGLAVLAADQFGRSIVRPVRELSDTAALLKEGDFSARVSPAGPPEIREVGAEFNQGDSVGTIESVKAVADLYLPVSGEIVAVNEAVADSPELVNQSPMDDGWLMKVKLSDPSEFENLLAAAAYEGLLGG